VKKNVASQIIGAQMITAADGTAFTGTVSALVTVDGGTQGAGGGAVTHEGNGFHSYTITQAETNGDHISVTFTGTGAIPATIQTYTQFPQTVDNNVLAAGSTGFSAIDTVVDTILVDTNDLQTNQGDWLTATGFNTVVPPSVAQFNARTRPDADYFSWATDAVAVVTLVNTLTTYTGNTPQTADHTAAIADVPTVAEFNARTLVAASYFDPAADAVANVTLCATTTTNTDMVATAPTVSQILTTQMTESYAADGVAPTLAQGIFNIQQNLGDFAYAGTTKTTKKIDGSTTAATYTLDDATNPTSSTRAS
jgi:hypothetical protein